MALSGRTRNALIGLAIGLGCAGFIILRLLQASAPQPTPVEIVNATPDVLHLDRVALGDGRVLGTRVDILGSVPGQRPTSFVSNGVPVAPGRPIVLSAHVAGRAQALTCDMEPRPTGTCSAQMVLDGPDRARCDYQCQPAPPP